MSNNFLASDLQHHIDQKSYKLKKTKQQQHVQLAIEKNRRKETRVGAKADHERMERNSSIDLETGVIGNKPSFGSVFLSQRNVC